MGCETGDGWWPDDTSQTHSLCCVFGTFIRTRILISVIYACRLNNVGNKTILRRERGDQTPSDPSPTFNSPISVVVASSSGAKQQPEGRSALKCPASGYLLSHFGMAPILVSIDCRRKIALRFLAVTTVPTPYLPAELLDQIVNHLHDKPILLKKCGLVSKSWIPRTRKYLFANIALHRGARAKMGKRLSGPVHLPCVLH